MYNQSTTIPVEERGFSSINGTQELRDQLPKLFSQYNIRSMFDAGANDAAWQIQTLADIIEYHAGERNAPIVALAKSTYPELSIQVHDITTDELPSVDLLFVRDVAIHMNNHYKRKMLDNWLSSSIPWILITQINDCSINTDFDQEVGEYRWAEVNWKLSPWYFPEPTYSVTDNFNQRYMSLWHKDQVKGLVCQWPV